MTQPSSIIIDDNNFDNHVDEEISACLKIGNPKSFFLFAGAGSGKTRSLVKALTVACSEHQRIFKVHGRKIGVITYTNAACDEIKDRLDFNPFVEVSTIHSFVWSLIEGFTDNIREWMRSKLHNDIEELTALEAKGRKGTKASIDRLKSIEVKTKKLTTLDTIYKFVYNPNGDARGRSSLTHADVIKIGTDFLIEKPLMQILLVNKFPFLLIDESQDTNRHLMEALLKVQSVHKARFALGLLGDTMQRIYSDGKVNLGEDLPDDWAKPVKKMNHRSSKRIITLINKIRFEIDGQQQNSRSDKLDGFVRLFIVNSSENDKAKIENIVGEKMAKLTGDKSWEDVEKNVKELILEHHMAAKRLNFLPMFEALNIDSIRTSLLDGSLPAVRFFSKNILPIIQAKAKNDDFGIAAVVRNYSPFLSKKNFTIIGINQTEQIKQANLAVKSLLTLWDNGGDPSFMEVLLNISESKLFEVPDSLKPIINRNKGEQKIVEDEIKSKVDIEVSEDEETEEKILLTINYDAFLNTKFSQIEPYINYIERKTNFDTHQGVKGLEFKRVMVIIDDAEARGFLFKYDKLFGVAEKTSTDINNEKTKTDSSEDRARRLFYVTCSRAEDSLAILAYTDNPKKVQENLIMNGWFEKNEIEIF